MMRIRIAVILPLLVLALGCSKKQTDNTNPEFNDKRVVLQVADNKLTLGEVLKRYATTEFKDVDQEYKVKSDMVKLTLERFLLIEGAKENGIKPTIDTSYFRRELLKQLYNKEILNKISISDKDIESFFNKYGGEVQAGHILVADSSLAESLYTAIKNGAEFEKIAKDFSQDQLTADKGGSLGYNPYGRFDDDFQNAIFSMKAGEVSRPIKSRNGWHIAKVFDRIKNTPADLEKDKSTYREQVHQYKQKTMVKDLVKDVKSEYNYKLNKANFDLLKRKADESKGSGTKQPGLPSSAYLDSTLFSDSELKLNLIDFDGGGVTIKDYLELMKTYRRAERAPELNDSGIMNDILEGMAMPILLEKLAYKEGLDKTETFKGDWGYLQGSDLMQQMKNKIQGQAGPPTEDEIVNYYNEHRQDFFMPDQIRASVIAVKTREEAAELLKRVEGGANFYQLAVKYSVDKKTGSQGGDLNFFTVARYTPIYKAAENMEKNQVGGPVEMDGNWWIFKLTDRILKKPKELDLVRSDVTNRVSIEKSQKLYNEWIENMKKKIPSTMNLELIKSTLKMGSLPGAEKSKG
jgi:foldase protein PrsA